VQIGGSAGKNLGKTTKNVGKTVSGTTKGVGKTVGDTTSALGKGDITGVVGRATGGVVSPDSSNSVLHSFG
jgi:hypothetical protein